MAEMSIAGLPTTPRLSRSPMLAVAGVVVVFALKLGVLFTFGPTMMPDSAGYIAYADQILTGGFLHVDLHETAIPITLARPIGYPAIIAAAKIVAGANWAWAVVLLQFAASIWATIMVYRLAQRFGLGSWACFGVAAAQATAMQFVLDQAILSDSLCASAMTVAACILSGAILRPERPNLASFLGAGALIAAAFLMRDVIAFLAIGFVPLAVGAAMRERSWPRGLTAFVLVFVPLTVTQRTYCEWNRERVGAPIVTSVSQWSLLYALGAASRYDPAIFGGSGPFDQVARSVFTSFGIQVELDEAHEANDILHRDYGWSAVRITHEATAAYLGAWMHHPVAMVRHTLIHFTETQLHQAVRPIETVRDVLSWNTGSDREFARDRAVRNGNWWMIPAVVAHRLAETASIAIFVAFIIVTPLRLMRDGWTAGAVASLGLWSAYLVFLRVTPQCIWSRGILLRSCPAASSSVLRIWLGSSRPSAAGVPPKSRPTQSVTFLAGPPSPFSSPAKRVVAPGAAGDARLNQAQLSLNYASGRLLRRRSFILSGGLVGTGSAAVDRPAILQRGSRGPRQASLYPCQTAHISRLPGAHAPDDDGQNPGYRRFRRHHRWRQRA
jgi:hypothetical protein